MTNLHEGKLPVEWKQEQQGGDKWQADIPIYEGMYNQTENEGQRRETQVLPTLYGENQLKGGFGPVYAFPSIPWQQEGNLNPGNSQMQVRHDQHSRNDQWQQWGSHSQAMPYCCGCCRGGYRYLW